MSGNARFSAISVPVGAQPVSVVLGDVNGDGHPDIVTANATANTASVRLGDGNGGFTGTTDVPVGVSPQSVALGDVNGDGKLDLVTANAKTGANTASVRLGNGTGGFSGTTEVPVGFAGTQSVSIALGDVNNDGKLDLVTADYSIPDNYTNPGGVSIRLGDGAGGFSGTTNLSAGNKPLNVILGDVNSDGKLDLIATGIDNMASVRLGAGNGNFNSSIPVSLGIIAYGAALGDVNGDGKLDLVAVGKSYSPTSSRASVKLGDGAGGFSGTTILPVGDDPRSVALGDVNEDGKLDLVTANVGFGANSASIRLGDGAGGFSGSTEMLVGTQPRCVALGDINGDGKLDIITANSGTSVNVVAVRLGHGADGFGGGNEVEAGRLPVDVVPCDLNGDGKLDLVTVNSNGVLVRLGNGAGGFGTITTVPVGAGPQSVALGDVNGDGKLDLVTANSGASASVRLGDGAGSFSGTTEVAVASNPSDVKLGDVNGDGKLDMVVATGGAANGGNGTSFVSVRLGDGAGGFSGTTNVPVGKGLKHVALGDVNQDGKLDFVTANYSSGVSVRLGDGVGGFNGTTEIPLLQPAWDVVLGDVNGDGKLDFVTANSGASASVRLGDGTGGFSGTTNVPVGDVPQRVALGDMNGDGKLDIVVANLMATSVSVRLGDGAGNFTNTTDVSVPTQPRGLALGDIDNDGDLDVFTANNDGFISGVGTVSIRLNGGGTGILALQPTNTNAHTALQLYPNPAHNNVRVLDAPAGADVQVLDMQGHLVRRFPAGTATLDMHGLSSGLYILRAGKQVARLVIE